MLADVALLRFLALIEMVFLKQRFLVVLYLIASKHLMSEGLMTLHLDVFGLWGETGVHERDQCRQKENMQT